MNDTAVTVPASTDDPRVQPVAKEVASLTERVETFQVANAADFEAGAELLKTIKGLFNTADSQRKKITQPLDQAKKQVMDLFRPFTDALTDAERKLKRRLTAWSDEQDRIAREEARKAEDRARKEREKLEREAEEAAAKGRDARADVLRDRAASTVATAPVTTAPKVSGISKRKIFKHRIVDASKVPDQYKTIDEKKIAGVVRALGAAANIPGVEVYEESVLGARRA